MHCCPPDLVRAYFLQGVLVALASDGFLWRTLLLLHCAPSLLARMRRCIVHFWPCRRSPCSISFMLTADYELSLVNTLLHNSLHLLLHSPLTIRDSGLPCCFLFPFFTPFFCLFLLALYICRLSSSFMIDILISLFLYTRIQPRKIHH